MNKTHTDTHMQKPHHTRLPTYTYTHKNTHKSMRAYTPTQPLIQTRIHTNICTRTCMHTHALTYTPTNHETSQIFTNTHTDARPLRANGCLHTHITRTQRNFANIHKHPHTRSLVSARAHTHTHSSAHIRIMRLHMQWAPLLYTHCSPLTRTPSFSSADDPMTRCGG